MSDSVATRIFHNDLGAARTVSTDSMKVIAIYITNTTAAPIEYEIQTGAGTQIFKVQVGADSTIDLEAPFITQGLIFAAEADTSHVTVLYRPGA
ncbi:MAG: hypothetical protein MN733_07005 [Nitrososphaera sp.]|nr:hypothetical protein [Nitrososphaera sp.]